MNSTASSASSPGPKYNAWSDAEIRLLRENFSLSSEGKLLRNGKVVKLTTNHSYQRVRCKSKTKTYAVHRLVYLLANGCDPYPQFVDHIDRNKFNNHPSNLRAVSHQVNLTNKNGFAKKRNLSAFLKANPLT